MFLMSFILSYSLCVPINLISTFFLFLFLLLPQKKEAKKSGFFADMNAPRSVHLFTAAAKVNWTLTRFRTPLYEAGHSHRFRTACRHFPRTQRHGMMQALRFAGPDKRIAVVKPLHRLRPRRGRILLTPDERSVIWGSACQRNLSAVRQELAPKH